MSNTSVDEVDRDLPFMSHHESWSDGPSHSEEMAVDEMTHSAVYWSVHNSTPAFDKKALTRIFEVFSELNTRCELLWETIRCDHRQVPPSSELVSIERGQLQSLLSRIAALEEKVGIPVECKSSDSHISEEIASTIMGLARAVFKTDIAQIEFAQSDEKSSVFVVVNVGPDAVPEDMSRKKTELHRRLLSEPRTATHGIRIKVVYR